ERATVMDAPHFDPELQPHAAEPADSGRERLPLWQAGLFVLAAGIGAQLAGALASGAAHAILRARGAQPDPLSAQVGFAAMLASSAALLVVALTVPRFAALPWSLALGLRRAPPVCFVAAALGTIMLGPTADCILQAMERFFPQANLGVLAMLHGLVREIPW